MGVDFIVFAFAPVYGPHVQGMAEDKGNVFLVAEISQPVPGKHAFGTDNNVFPVWLDCSKEDFRIGPDVSVQDCLPVSIENAQIHFVGVPVDSTIKIVLFGVKSHEKASFV